MLGSIGALTGCFSEVTAQPLSHLDPALIGTTFSFTFPLAGAELALTQPG